MDVCDFDDDDDKDYDDEDDDDEDDDIVYLLQGSVHKFGLHASVDAPLVPDEAQSRFLFFSPLSLLNSVHKFNESRVFTDSFYNRVDSKSPLSSWNHPWGINQNGYLDRDQALVARN